MPLKYLILFSSLTKKILTSTYFYFTFRIWHGLPFPRSFYTSTYVPIRTILNHMRYHIFMGMLGPIFREIIIFFVSSFLRINKMFRDTRYYTYIKKSIHIWNKLFAFLESQLSFCENATFSTNFSGLNRIHIQTKPLSIYNWNALFWHE